MYAATLWVITYTIFSFFPGIPIVLWIVETYFDSNENVAGVSALMIGLLMCVNLGVVVFFLTWRDARDLKTERSNEPRLRTMHYEELIDEINRATTEEDLERLQRIAERSL